MRRSQAHPSLRERLFYFCAAVARVKADSETPAEQADHFTLATKEDANLIGSLCGDGYHRPVLDIDFEAHLVPSSTPGHFHLYLDKQMTWETYEKLLDALVEADIISTWYAKFSKDRRMTHVRCPWVKKPTQNADQPADAAPPKQLPAAVDD